MDTLAASSAARARALGVPMVLAAAVLWGTTGTAQSLAPTGLSAYWVGALRLLLASAFFAAYALWQAPPARVWQQLRSLPPGSWLLAGASMAAYNLAFFAGVKATGVAAGTAVAIGSGPIWAGLLEWTLHRKPPPASWWAGTLMAIAGGVMMVLDGGAPLQLSPLGVGLCLVAGLSYAVYAMSNKQLVASASPATATLGAFGLAALLALPVAAAVSGGVQTSAAGWLVVSYLGVVTTGVAYLLFSSALRHIRSATGVTLALAEPVTAFVLAIVVVNERPGALAMLGLALVLAGLALVVWQEIRARN
jgi:drug/metabolite transporter, DME family